METQNSLPVGADTVKRLHEILSHYKRGKAAAVRRIISAENWWRLRNTAEEGIRPDGSFKSVSGWLHNVIVSKHADAMDYFPEPVILPREKKDVEHAAVLSAIIPCILEQNGFEKTYSDVLWQKLKTGTGVYKVAWDPRKHGGLGDIAIERVNLLDVYFEPGITDIQKSRYLFHTERCDIASLEERYPHLAGKITPDATAYDSFRQDEVTNPFEKCTVIEAYYHKNGLLHYCKFVSEHLLYASENDPALCSRGMYDHGRYPYFFDVLFPIEDSPLGYGFVDLCRSPQTEIDLLKTSFVKNAMVGAAPRYFYRQDGSVNTDDFLDLTKPLVKVDGNLGQDSIRKIEHGSLDGVYVSVFDRVIEELRQTSGNTETATGNIRSGVTAASAIAALQEASGKGSRDSAKSSWRIYGGIVEMCIELIRQFYTLPRQFRITGDRFVSFSGGGIAPVMQGEEFGIDLGLTKPPFDVKVSAQRQNAYAKITQNELALQFFNMGFFNPQNASAALSCLEMMDFDGKERIMEHIQKGACGMGSKEAPPALHYPPGSEIAARRMAADTH